jgi:fatty acid desaturase
MKIYPEELHNHLKSIHQGSGKLHFPMNDHIYALLQNEIQKLRFLSKEYPKIHFMLQLFPIIILTLLYICLLLCSVKLSTGYIFIDLLLFAAIHGVLSYSFVVYTLHEGAGHGLFRNIPWLKNICFNLSRLFFADPEYYKTVHSAHHRFLGTDKDGAFTHFVLPKRILKSMLPGAGILFKNDYKIAQPDIITSSTIISIMLGLFVIFLQTWFLKQKYPITYVIFALIIVSPWISMLLDRIRETIEHCLLPSNNHTGSWELGPNFLGFLIGGGPWGQPCHFSHHLAPDLNWYQQLILHRKIKKNLPTEFTEQFGFNISVNTRIKNVIKYYLTFTQKQKINL